ncbi:MAG: alginate export family protein [Burkholderiales bacterium]|nr:alginate export family protein [Burkholderiales bacterium]
MPARALLRRLGWALGLAAVAAAAVAQSPARPPRAAVSDTPLPGVVRAELPPQQFTGYAVNLLFLDLYGGSGSDERDRALRTRIEQQTQRLRSGPFNQPLTEQVVAALSAEPGLRDVRYAVYASERPGSIVLVISATLTSDGASAARGWLVDGQAGSLPVLYESADALLRLQLNVWAGFFSDYNPWFASAPTYTAQSPIALDPPGPGRTSWVEGMVEFGIAGATRFGAPDLYLYGEATGMTSGATGQDLFRSDTRTETLWEKVYAGVLWAQPETQRSARLSVGRQNWQLNNGFLFSRYAAGANAGPNPGLYLNPRTTYQMAVLAEARQGPFELEFFDLDPAELKGLDSHTRFQGLRAAWQEDARWDLGLAAYRVPESNTLLRSGNGSVVPREGERTLNLRVGHRDLGAGFSALAEAAWQDSTEAAISARAWYAQLAYTAKTVDWKPSVLFRYATFSGDRPDTATREAFDAPLSSGLDEWVQGVNFKKVVTNSNLNSYRLRFNAGPDPRLNFTIDAYHLWADVPLPTGQQTYGNELDFYLRWSITRQLFLLGVAGIAWPGDVIKAQTQGAARPWSTVQVSLFWGF